MAPNPRPTPTSSRIPTGFLDRTLRTGTGASARRYQVYVPDDFDAIPSRRWPVILFLHGSGERGSDGMLPTAVGLGSTIRFHRDWFPAIVVFPQAAEGGKWSGADADAALAALDASIAEFHGDPDRVALVGMSMGGRGAIQIGAAHPERFAAVVAVCGWVVPTPEIAEFEGAPAWPAGVDPYAETAKALAKTRVRLYHGAEDDVVPVAESRRLAKALAAIGAGAADDYNYKEFPGVGHGSWDPAFDDAALWAWVFSQRRAPAPAR